MKANLMPYFILSNNSEMLSLILRVEHQLLPELSRLGTINVMAAAETISRPKAKEFIFANSHFEIIAAHFESN